MAFDMVGQNCVEFPGRAGELQRAEATAALLRELGGNYPTYHAFLQERLEDTGGDPDPADFEDDPTGYGERCHALQRIVASEILLRRARALRQGRGPGRGLPPGDPPLYDADKRLVDADHPERSRFRGTSRLVPPIFQAG